MRLKKPFIAATAAAALVSLAACGSSGGGGGATGSSDTFKAGGGAGSILDPTRQAPAPPIPGAKKGGTVTVLSASGLTTMDPTEAYYVNTGSILSGLVTRSLTQWSYDKKSGEMILIPDLATDLGTPNKDFTQWTFTMRKGVKYENGQAVTPQDIKYGIERSFDRSTFPGGATYSNDFFLHGDTYKGPYKSGTNYDGVVIHGQNITIKMARPFPDMPYWGAFAAMGPIPPGKASDPSKYSQHPLATGPYKFASYSPGESLTLVRNQYWDPNTDPGRTAYPDKYDMHFTENSKQIDQTILSNNGSGSSTLTFDNLLAADYQTAKATANDQLTIGTTPCTAMYQPDYRVIKNITVRRAIGYAYPYQDAWTAAGEIIGVTRSPGGSMEPPGIPGRVNYNVLGNKPGTFDPQKSIQLLKKAGYKPGEFELKFLYSTDDPISVDVKDQLVKGFTKAGFKATPVATTTNQYYTLRADPNYHKINIRSYGWCSDWPSGLTWLPPMLGSDHRGQTNLMFFSEPSVDKKISQIETLPLPKQPAAWGALDKLVEAKYYPFVNVGYYGDVMAHGSSIMGMSNDAIFAMPTWKDMWVKQ